MDRLKRPVLFVPRDRDDSDLEVDERDAAVSEIPDTGEEAEVEAGSLAEPVDAEEETDE